MLEQLAIRCRGLSKSFGEVVALDDFNLDIWQGNLIGLLGPSGCGKTTALRTIAGFERPQSGSIEVHGRTVVDDGIFVEPESRNVGMVFQDYALFPHKTVGSNVGFGLRGGNRRRVEEVLELVGLTGLGSRMPHELSGGQQQRVALARALAPQPDVILLDEPFSNLDASLRQRVRRDVRAILKEAETTSVFVTHDQEEALAMSDVLAVMTAGTVVQAAEPDQLYLHPANRWVAGFIGDADFLDGEALGGVVSTVVGRFPTDLEGPVSVMIRPESVGLVGDAAGPGVVLSREYFGHDQIYTVRLDSGEVVRARTGPYPILAPAARVRLEIDHIIAFPR